MPTAGQDAHVRIGDGASGELRDRTVDIRKDAINEPHEGSLGTLEGGEMTHLSNEDRTPTLGSEKKHSASPNSSSQPSNQGMFLSTVSGFRADGSGNMSKSRETTKKGIKIT